MNRFNSMSLLLVSLAALLLTQAAPGTAALAADQIPFSLQVIDPTPPDRPYSKMVGDLDGDGDLDVIVAGAKGPLVWYANPHWQRREIAAGGWDCVRGAVADLDGDGALDVVLGGLVWFRNPGSGRDSWQLSRVEDQRLHDVAVADLNLDGRLDIVGRDQSAFGQAGDRVHIYYQEEPTNWQRVTLPCPHGEGIQLFDLDGDSDQDIVLGGRWLENRREREAQQWPVRTYTDSWTEPDAKVAVGDINGDGRPDIVLAPAELKGETYKIAWYEAPRSVRSADWREHVIAAPIECVVHSLAVADFDLDGDLDVATAEMHQGADPDEVCVWRNEHQGTSWQKQVLATSGSHDIVAVDLDADGDMDIIGANHAGTSPLQWWRNDTRMSK